MFVYIYIFGSVSGLVVCSGGLSDYSCASTFTFEASLYVVIHAWGCHLSLHFFFLRVLIFFKKLEF